jgi:hypothetical protein
VWSESICLILFFEQFSDVKTKITGNKKRNPLLSTNIYHSRTYIMRLRYDKLYPRWLIWEYITEKTESMLSNLEQITSCYRTFIKIFMITQLARKLPATTEPESLSRSQKKNPLGPILSQLEPLNNLQLYY